MKTSTVGYCKVETLEEALHQMQSVPNAIFVAGGTDAFVNREQGNLEARNLIDISGVKSLKTISSIENELVIGALITLETIVNSTEISASFPALAVAARSVATPVIRKTATIGGNILCENRCSFYNQSEWWRRAVGYCLKCSGDICIATGGKKSCFSKYVSDTAPVLIAYRSMVTLMNSRMEKVLPLETIFSGDGVKPVSFEKDTLLKSIHIPKANIRVVFKKLRPRKSLDFTSLTTAVSLDEKQNLRIVVGGVDPKPVVVDGNLSNGDLDTLKSTAYRKPRVVDNDFYPRQYRKEMIKVFIEESLSELSIGV